MEFITYLNRIRKMSPELIDHLPNIVKTVTVKKNEYLLNDGDVCENIWFIKKGLVRCFILKHDGEELCKWFRKEYQLVYDITSFYKQKPSSHYIQALENCTLQYITYDQLVEVFYLFPEFYHHSGKWSDKHLKTTLIVSRILTESNPYDRYKSLIQFKPEWFRRVPTKYLASYLNVSLSTFDRLKKIA